MLFCSSRGFDPYKATPAQALDFMTDLFEQGLGYSAMNTVRSSLSQVLHSPTGVSFGELPTVKQFIKGFSRKKPTLPKYSVTWDPDMTSLFIIYVKPHKAASKDIISRWIKTTLGLAGIDMTRFKSHSIRASSTSAAATAKFLMTRFSELLVGQDIALLQSITRNQSKTMENWPKLC